VVPKWWPVISPQGNSVSLGQGWQVQWRIPLEGSNPRGFGDPASKGALKDLFLLSTFASEADRGTEPSLSVILVFAFVLFN